MRRNLREIEPSQLGSSGRIATLTMSLFKLGTVLCELLIFRDAECVEVPLMVRAGARIHLGLIDLSGVMGRLYGSVGIYVDAPGFEAVVEKGEGSQVYGGGKAVRARAEEVLKKLDVRGLRVKVKSSIPPHVGLGSGTQTLMALGSAANILYGLRLNAEELALKLGRCSRSGAGFWLFLHGGLVVDGGKRIGEERVPPLIARLDVPERWRIIIALPEEASEGLTGRREEETFKRMRGEADLAMRASWLTLMKLLPALAEGDLESFGEAASELDKLTGSYFAEAQGGVYAKRSRELVEAMLRAGAAGVGQSSWGPAVYGFVGSEGEGESIAEKVGKMRCRVIVARPLNRGAEITRYSRSI